MALKYSRPVWTSIITLVKEKWWRRTLLLKVIWLKWFCKKGKCLFELDLVWTKVKKYLRLSHLYYSSTWNQDSRIPWTNLKYGHGNVFLIAHPQSQTTFDPEQLNWMIRGGIRMFLIPTTKWYWIFNCLIFKISVF